MPAHRAEWLGPRCEVGGVVWRCLSGACRRCHWSTDVQEAAWRVRESLQVTYRPLAEG